MPEWGMITSVVMPGGWHYPQLLSSGQTVKITGFSFEQLLANMLEFRQQHIELCGHENANIESVRADLKKYLCANFKQNCADANAAPPQRTGIGVTDYKRPIDRAANWIAAVALVKNEYVDLGLAGHRAQICAQCAQNVRWATSCAPCNDNVEVRVRQIKGNMRTPYDRNLFSCRIFGHINEVAVWMTDTRSSSEQKPPAHCWKEQNG